jgi:hypothetical protein
MNTLKIIVLLFCLVVIMIAIASHANGQAMPNKQLTPGAISTTDVHKLCRPGFATSVRHVTQSMKRQVYLRYGVTPVTGRCCEVDHLIPLCLGGANVVENLWPEPYTPRPGAHEKDKTEVWLYGQVCHGKMSLKRAQSIIRDDWYSGYELMEKSK